MFHPALIPEHENAEKIVSDPSMIQGCQRAKFGPFLSLDCARVEGSPRKGRDQYFTMRKSWRPADPSMIPVHVTSI